MSENDTELIRLNDDIKEEYLALCVFDSQKSFIETPRASLNDAISKAWNIDWKIECIYSGGQMIGYAMHGINIYGDVWLDRFMIDKRFQHRGLGSAALAKILPVLKALYPKRRHIYLSVEHENENAVKLYEKFGFFLTGDIEDGEDVMCLEE